MKQTIVHITCTGSSVTCNYYYLLLLLLLFIIIIIIIILLLIVRPFVVYTLFCEAIRRLHPGRRFWRLPLVGWLVLSRARDMSTGAHVPQMA
jgi:hypothetical protein